MEQEYQSRAMLAGQAYYIGRKQVMEEVLEAISLIFPEDNENIQILKQAISEALAEVNQILQDTFILQQKLELWHPYNTPPEHLSNN